MESKQVILEVSLQHTEQAGYFYTNIISQTVGIFGLKARYQEGNSNGAKRHFWFLNEAEVDPSTLPQKAWGIVEGDVITNDQYRELQNSIPSSTPVESKEESTEEPF